MSRASLHLFGCGNVGGHLLSILCRQRDAIAARHGIDIDVVAITNRNGTWFDADGLDPTQFTAGVQERIDPALVIDRVARLPYPIFVDVSAFDGASNHYLRAFRRGLAVVTANKIPLVAASDRHRTLVEAARAARRPFLYETTVGADLPVLGPIFDRLQSGDRIVRVEGSLSGTLGFVGDAVSRGVPFAEALESARVRGYTEPDPREDLSGRDVARKALILARSIGLDLDIDDVVLSPFTRGLDDEAFDRYACEVRSRGKLLRYLAVIDPSAHRPLRVGPEEVEPSHPAAALRGTEAMVSLTTERCGDVPVVVRGPGAGGAVTASGVLADILRALGDAGASGRPSFRGREPRTTFEGQYLR